jgi:Uma2 family endonuclease
MRRAGTSPESDEPVAESTSCLACTLTPRAEPDDLLVRWCAAVEKHRAHAEPVNPLGARRPRRRVFPGIQGAPTSRPLRSRGEFEPGAPTSLVGWPRPTRHDTLTHMAQAQLPVDSGSSMQQWADDDSALGEYVDGNRTEEEVPSFLHDAIAGWLVFVIRTWLQKGGWVLPSEAKFAVAPDKGRKPDVSVYLRGAAPSRHASLFDIPPFIAIEVLSPSPRDQQRDRVTKLIEYAEFGIRFYWIIDPEMRIVTIHELEGGRYAVALSASEGQHQVPGCKGFVLDLDALWTEVDELPE